MLANLVNSLFGNNNTTAETEVTTPDKTDPKAARNRRKKDSKKRDDQRSKPAQTASAFESGKTLHATDQNFKAMVLDSPVPVLVDFWAPWCGPCQAMGPAIDALAVDVGHEARIVKVDVDQNPQISAQYGIRSIPTMMVFAGGEKKKSMMGLTSKGKLAKILARYA